jgi:ADP-heptose:LPS heptosyltransferase
MCLQHHPGGLKEIPGRISDMRILIILKYCYIGDAIVSLPLIKGVHRQWPEAELTVLTCKGARTILSLDPELAGVNFVR